MTPSSLIKGNKKNIATEAIVGLFGIVLTALVVAALYFGREFLIPLALSALLTFMLSPLVARIECRIGRVPAVFSVAILIFICLGALGWVITRQAIDLATKLPDYRANIQEKLHSLELSKEGPIKRLSQMFVEVGAEIPGFEAPEAAAPATGPVKAGASPSTPNRIEHEPSRSINPLDQVRWIATPFLSVLGTTGLVMVLVVFMLLKREDLRGRIIRIIGAGRISTTSSAMQDAGTRMSRYLVTQLIVNVAFGATVALGLHGIGLPNAFLWGALTAVLRFVPYIGVWLAALCPTVLAFAVSPGWLVLLSTLLLYGFLELVTSNLLEPLVYRSSTGVSSLALIVSTIFWTWLWGPIGLVLSTPLTVCVAVIGRHVPKLSFFSVLLGDEEALTPTEECYHRLLVGGLHGAGELVDSYIKANSLTALYDEVLVPTVTLAEMDFIREELDDNQRARVLQGVREIINDLEAAPIAESKLAADQAVAAESSSSNSKSDCRVICLPTRGERDEVPGAMLVHLLRQHGFEASAIGAEASLAMVLASIGEQNADVACISVVPPSTIIHARNLCAKLRASYPKLKIVVGLWGATENLDDAIKGLRSSGADEVVVSMAEAMVQLVKLSAALIGQMVPAALPVDEADRLAALARIKAFTQEADPAFDRMTKNLTRMFNVSIALISFIDRDRQLFKSHFGLPDEFSGVTNLPREQSVCAHVVTANASIVIEDLSHDRRFANNPLVRKHHLRFYAGAPLHSSNGQPLGALCLFDFKPRTFSEAEKRLLKIMAEEISEGLSLRPTPALALPNASTPTATPTLAG